VRHNGPQHSIGNGWPDAPDAQFSSLPLQQAKAGLCFVWYGLWSASTCVLE
jgi:hypothetical protein